MPEIAPPPAAPPRPPTIVAIDDDGATLSLLQEMLEPAGYRVLCSADPHRGIALIRQEKPDLVLCDIVMPGLDGYGVYQAIQDSREPAARGFVFLTAQAGLGERIRAFRAGVVDFMSKPFTQAIVQRRVEKLLARVRGPMGEARAILPEEPAGGKPAGPRKAVDFGPLPAELRRVLVVDDDPHYRRLLRSVLETHGFTVFETADGGAALRDALEHQPWLILCDVNMPGLDGYELCRQFRSHALLRSLPFIFLSGRDEYSDRCMGYEAGADEYLAKMTPMREILIRVRLVLERLSGAWARRGGGVIEGDVGIIGPAGVLKMGQLGGVSGVFAMDAGDGSVEIRFRDGQVVGARCDELTGPEAVFEFLSWSGGRFTFRPGDPGPGAPFEQSISELVLESLRRLDESRRADA
jgi:DNA-binding response OmpR family regulator